MYEECMDGIPLPVEGCYQHNITEYTRATKYYEKQNNKEIAEMYRNYANQERVKLEEYNSLGFLQKIIRRLKQ